MDVSERALQHLVAAGADAGDGRLDLDVRLDAHALQLPAVRVADVVAGEADAEAAGQREVRDVAVRAGGGRADERRAVRGLEEEAGVLRLADGAVVDQRHHLPAVLRLPRPGRRLLEEEAARAFLVRVDAGELRAAELRADLRAARG